MRNFISYCMHFIKSKRRHGTHSPYVYAYADQILKNYPLWKYPWSTKNKQLQIEKLIKDYMLFVNKKIDNQSFSNIHNEHASYASIENCKNFSIKIIEVLDNESKMINKETIILVKDPHKNATCSNIWKRLIQEPKFNLTLDLWHIGILIYSPAFKSKQHYLLK